MSLSLQAIERNFRAPQTDMAKFGANHLNDGDKKALYYFLYILTFTFFGRGYKKWFSTEEKLLSKATSLEYLNVNLEKQNINLQKQKMANEIQVTFYDVDLREDRTLVLERIDGGFEMYFSGNKSC